LLCDVASHVGLSGWYPSILVSELVLLGYFAAAKTAR
jgi:hypothetical protein